MGKLGSVGADQCLSLNITGLENLKRYIALFNKIPLLGAKALDYKDFCLGMDIIATGAHLTPAGIDLLKQIVNGMNSASASWSVREAKHHPQKNKI